MAPRPSKFHQDSGFLADFTWFSSDFVGTMPLTTAFRALTATYLHSAPR
jgi:hypothetical protein